MYVVADSAHWCSWAAMASAGNVNAVVTLLTMLHQRLQIPLAAVVAQPAAEAYDSEVVHCQPVRDQEHSQASACNNAMCRFRLSETITNN